MRVAILHYHMRRGGVTRVVERALASLRSKPVTCCILTGEALPETVSPGAPVGVIEELAYGQYVDPGQMTRFIQTLREKARSLLGGVPDVWHIHNHALGKNLTMPALVQRLARDGDAMLLQIHDFAEDGRPSNYRYLSDFFNEEGMAQMYPFSSRIHYALLNGRDYRFLEASGIAPSSLHYLPNAVTGALPDAKSDVTALPGLPQGDLYLYPTRAIRRKNLGEFILWSALAQEGEWFGTTLAPENPAARPVYDRWVAFAGNLRLPVFFDLGNRATIPFDQMVHTARALVTTSVAEGFGLAFLEPWLTHKLLLGRDLPEITNDFRDAGICLEHLYDRLEIPLEWIDLTAFKKAVTSGLKHSLSAYGRTCRDADVEEALFSAVRGEWVDFGRLSEPFQEAVIERACHEKLDRSLWKGVRTDRDFIRRQCEVISGGFGIEQYGDQLSGRYEKLCHSSDETLEYADPRKILDAFTDPSRFHLLRTS